MITHLPRPLAGFLLTFALWTGLWTASFRIGVASADNDPAPTHDSGAAADAAAEPPPSTGPADQLHDPIDDPGPAYDDLVRAKKSGGWALALLAGFVMITRVLARLPGSLGAWFRVGVRATVVAAGGAIGVAAFNALALGGTWIAVLFAAVGAGLALITPIPPPKPAEPPAPAPARA